MTHDPMCPNTHSLVVADDTPCQCDLIARVREDERAAALRDAIAAVKSREDGDYFPWVQVEIATAAIQDLQP